MPQLSLEYDSIDYDGNEKTPAVTNLTGSYKLCIWW